MADIFPSAHAQFEQIGGSLQQSMDRISAKERHINKEFNDSCSDFQEKQTQLKYVSDHYNSLNQTVGDLSAQLQAVTDEVELAK